MDSYDGNGLLLSRESNLLLENGELRRMNDTEEKKRKGDDFLLQGAILAAAGIIVRFIGLIYKIPMTRILGDEGIGYYNTAYEIYNIGLLPTACRWRYQSCWRAMNIRESGRTPAGFWYAAAFWGPLPAG